MEYTYPDYYREFVCTGSACRDNCCAAGWQIAIDEESLDMYKNMEGDIGVRIRNSIDWKTGLFEQYEHKCALLNEKGLCDVYCDAGEDKMCVLCQRYPRHYEEYENLREISLSISCPEAARIVLTRKEKTGFYTEKDETEEEYEDFDYLMFTKLVEIREFLFKTVQDRTIPFKYRMAVVLKAVHDVQNLINKDEIFEIDELLDKLNQPDYTKRVIKSLKVYENKAINRKEYLAAMMAPPGTPGAATMVTPSMRIKPSMRGKSNAMPSIIMIANAQATILSVEPERWIVAQSGTTKPATPSDTPFLMVC